MRARKTASSKKSETWKQLINKHRCLIKYQKKENTPMIQSILIKQYGKYGLECFAGCFRAAVPNIFGARDRCSYVNLTPDDLKGSWSGDARAGERPQTQVTLCQLTSHSPPVGWPCSQQARTGARPRPRGLGTPALEDAWKYWGCAKSHLLPQSRKGRSVLILS